MLGAMKTYQIFFYTAGIRKYGKLIMEIIKDLIPKEENQSRSQEVLIENTFSEDRLIARDDNERFLSSQDQL